MIQPSFRRAVSALAACAGLGLSGPASSASTVLPGYWESTSHFSVLVIEKTSVTRKCLTREEVEQWLTRPTLKHYSCDYTHRQIGAAKVSLDGSCSDKKGRTMVVHIRGAYTPEHFHLAATGYLMLGVPLPAEGEIDAHRLSGTCPETPTSGG